MEKLEAVLFALEDGGIRLVGRTTNPAVVSATRDAIARDHAERAADLERLRPSGLRLVTDSEQAGDSE